MKKFLAGLLAAAAGCLVSAQAFAFGTIMCYPDVAFGPNGPRTWYNPSVANSTLLGQSANNPYVFGSQGCAYINQADIAAALAVGMSQGNPTGTLNALVVGPASGTTSFGIGNLPANTYIVSIYITNVTANAVTGGVNIGNAGTAAAYVSAGTVAASTIQNMTLVTPLPSTTAPTAAPYNTPGTPLFVAAVTSWNTATIAITVTYEYF